MSKILMIVFILSMVVSVYNLINADYIWATIFACWTIAGLICYIFDIINYINKLEERIAKLEGKK
jgi:predicted membrane channel-forming protein YqfA (hemolysin III family)